jgi:hypothetical protein
MYIYLKYKFKEDNMKKIFDKKIISFFIILLFTSSIYSNVLFAEEVSNSRSAVILTCENTFINPLYSSKGIDRLLLECPVKIEKISKNKISISIAGKYLFVSQENENTYIRWGKTTIDETDTFNYIKLKNGKFALKTMDNKYICIKPGSDNYIYADSDKITEYAKFTEVGIDYISIKGNNGKYLEKNYVYDYKFLKEIFLTSSSDTKNYDTKMLLLSFPNNKISIATQYSYTNEFVLLSTHGNINLKLNFSRNFNPDYNLFDIVKLENNRLAFKSLQGMYLNAKNENPVIANSEKISEWETFIFEKY